MDIFISSRNPDKIKEIKKVLRHLPVKLYTVNDFPALPEVEEDSPTLLGNALKKAKAIAAKTKMATISDDTGLFVDALNGNPGVKSARYAGDSCSYADNVKKLLSEMKNKQDRKARFITVAVLFLPNGEYAYTEGVLEGLITIREVGSKGFGYDPVFLIPSTNKTLAEMTMEEKNLISHRGKAFRNLAQEIKHLFTNTETATNS